MSATYGVLRSDKTGTSATKAGRSYVSATAQTWRTFATVTTWRDGRVSIEIRRDDHIIIDLEITAEDEPLTLTVNRNDAYTLPSTALQSMAEGA